MNIRRVRGIFCAVCVVLCSDVFCADTTAPQPEPYGKTELPQWGQDLTRFGLITIGTLPFTTLFIELGYKEIVTTNWSYVPFSDSVELTEDEQKNILLWAVCSSFGCAVIDLLIQKIVVQRNEREREQDAIHGSVDIEEIEEFSASRFKVSPDIITRELQQSGGTLLPSGRR